MVPALFAVYLLNRTPETAPAGRLLGLSLRPARQPSPGGLAGLMRRPWVWTAGTVLQVVLFVSGFFVHGALSAFAVLFGLTWGYVLYVRRTVLGGRR